MQEHIDKLHFVAQYLLKHESMDGDQFVAAMKDGATEADLDAIAEAKAEESRRANEKAAEERARREAEEAARREQEANGENGNGEDGGENGEDTVTTPEPIQFPEFDQDKNN